METGEFATNVELSESIDYERDRISESLWYLYHDLSEEGKAHGYFDFIERGGGSPEETKRLSEALKNLEYLKETIKEYSRFLAGYKENRDVLRFHYHKVDSLYQKLQELDLPRKEYSTNLTEFPKVKPFITDDEVLATLSRGSGIDKGKERITKFFKENLTQVEYEAARESTLTAFYTPKTVIDGVYRTLFDMGFKSGNILEPSMGVGNFIGNLPDEMKKSKFYGVELDSVSGRIGKLLYPESDIQIKGFEETSFSNNFFDAVIGNVPFGEYKLNDREYNKNNFLIHDYFFAKSTDKVRNGGIIAFITSSGTMNKKDESVRCYIAARAEFLGVIRLPNDTFKGVAGTEVTSDIIFLKKRDSIRER